MSDFNKYPELITNNVFHNKPMDKREPSETKREENKLGDGYDYDLPVFSEYIDDFVNEKKQARYDRYIKLNIKKDGVDKTNICKYLTEDNTGYTLWFDDEFFDKVYFPDGTYDTPMFHITPDTKEYPSLDGYGVNLVGKVSSLDTNILTAFSQDGEFVMKGWSSTVTLLKGYCTENGVYDITLMNTVSELNDKHIIRKENSSSTNKDTKTVYSLTYSFLEMFNTDNDPQNYWMGFTNILHSTDLAQLRELSPFMMEMKDGHPFFNILGFQGIFYGNEVYHSNSYLGLYGHKFDPSTGLDTTALYNASCSKGFFNPNLNNNRAYYGHCIGNTESQNITTIGRNVVTYEMRDKMFLKKGEAEIYDDTMKKYNNDSHASVGRNVLVYDKNNVKTTKEVGVFGLNYNTTKPLFYIENSSVSEGVLDDKKIYVDINNL